MKLSILDRVLLVILTLFSLLLGVLFLGMALHYVTDMDLTFWVRCLYDIPVNRVFAAVIGAALVVVSLKLLFSRAPSAAKTPQAIKVRVDDVGSILISLGALDQMVQKVMGDAAYVKSSQTRVIPKEEDKLGIYVKVQLAPDTNVPESLGALQREVKAYVQDMSGIEVSEVQIYVDAPAAQSRGI